LNVLEWLFALALVRAVFADHLIRECSIEQVLHDLLFFGTFNQVFNLVNQRVEEFIDVFLDSRVDRAAINVLECFTKLFGIVVLFLQVHQAAKDAFDLIQNIFIGLLV